MNRSPLLIAKNISKSFFTPFPLPILKQIDLTVLEGESIAITGKSGEGKSTLLHILGTLEKPCTGELILCGHSIHSTPLPLLRNQYIGFIFQGFHLLEEMTVLDNVLMPAKIGRSSTVSGSSPYKRAQNLIDRVGLTPRAHFLVKHLSGGEKQRVAIARALLNDPPLILADEPSGNLDHAHSQIIHQLLLELTCQQGKTLIVVTHDRELASLCHQQYSLKDGLLCIS